MLQSGSGGGSLEQHLTNSIRRAKERIYNNAITHYAHDLSLSSITYTQAHNQRQRTNSTRIHPQHRDDSNVLAEAMRTLQAKIAHLEQENRQLILKNASKSSQEHPEQRQELEMSAITGLLRQKSNQAVKLTQQNAQLNKQNTALLGRIQELQEEVDRLVTRQLNTSHSQFTEQQQAKEEALRQKEAIIKDQEQLIDEQKQQISQLEIRCRSSEETILQLTHKLQEERRTNMRWIKLHEAQLEADQKENNSLQANQPPPVKHTPKHDPQELVRKNKQMYENLQRSKAKISDLTKECKQQEEKFNELRLIALEMVESVNKLYPHHNGSHLKYLTTKILKLETSHIDSLRSFSNHNTRNSRRLVNDSRSRRIDSGSKQRKRSLKISDLNSSAKKSQEHSHSKSHRKKQPLEQQTQSQKKRDRQEKEEEQLQKEVQALMKKYRNLVTKGEKDKNNQQITRQIQETAKEYNQKKLKCEQLRKLHKKKETH